jgi:antirestriction protein ArdC
MTKSGAPDLHRRITEQIVEAIEAGAGEYRMPWHAASGSGRALRAPHNPVGKYRYRGINILTLWCAQQSQGFRSSQWASYRQWLTAGRQVRQGEIGTPTVLYREQAPFSEANFEKRPDDGESDTRPRLYLVRSGTVFNADQVDGAEPSAQDRVVEPEPFPVAAALIARSGAVIRPNRTHACYLAAMDEIHLPPRTDFVSEHAYYGVAFHELTHWTGHPRRCARDLTGRFGSDSYAVEELIAELGSAFLSAEVGLSAAPRVDHAQYIDSWLRVLRSDSKAVFLAAGRATEAAAYVLPPCDAAETAPS